jgi:hypothetical protein
MDGSTDPNYFDPKQAADEDQNVLMCRVRRVPRWPG